jgi:integrase
MPRKPRSKVWQYQKGEYSNTVTATERLDRDRTIEVRWWVPALHRFQRRSLGFSIRDASGSIVPELEQQAVRQTQSIYDALMAGRSPLEGPQSESAPLTLRAGFDLATEVPTGLYVVESEHLKDVRRAARDIVEVIGRTARGDPRTWDSLNNGAVRELWLGLARRFKATKAGGPSWTERCVVVLLQVSQWLAAEERITRAVVIKKAWREQLRREWEQYTSSRITKSTPRHSEDEIRRMFAVLEHPDADPRIALALQLGAEARLGQVRRLMRSDVDLSPVGVFGLGRVVVHGSGKKMGVRRDLTPEERAAIDRALAGYLRPLEEAYQDKLRQDYPIFPAGRLRLDVAPSRASRRKVPVEPIRRAKLSVTNGPMDKRTLNDQFHELERIAKVESVPGRGWYGIRRRATDVYEDYEKDERVLNDQTGHKKSETRREVYQERERETIRARSAETRRRVRNEAFGQQLLTTESDPST